MLRVTLLCGPSRPQTGEGVKWSGLGTQLERGHLGTCSKMDEALRAPQVFLTWAMEMG